MSRSIVFGCFIAIIGGCEPGDAEGPRPMESMERSRVEMQPPPDTPHAEPSSAETSSGEGEGEGEGEATPPAPVRATALASGRGARRRRPTNRCERLRLHIDADGRRRHQRLRRSWGETDRRRFAKLVGMVSKEMGADARLIRAWAMRESTYRPHAVHTLNPDIEAATAAWRRRRYSAEEEAQLQQALADTSAQDPKYWQAKARLHEVQTFRDNIYLDEVIEVEVIAPDGSSSPGTEPAWAFGYGPFGFNPAYYVPVWDSRSPPWVFCDDDGLAAIITAVWAARAAQRECDAQGFGGSYATVNRRFSRGHCGEVSEGASFRERAKKMGLDPDARAKLGSRWPRSETDREEILRHMRSKAIAEGLLSAHAEAGA